MADREDVVGDRLQARAEWEQDRRMNLTAARAPITLSVAGSTCARFAHRNNRNRNNVRLRAGD